MQKIKSFEIDHTKLEKGLYISRVDGDIITYDLRMVKPNTPPFLENGGIHTFEHLMATYLRNSENKENVIYVGPMGCRTGFYVIFKGNLDSKDIIDIMKEMFKFIADYEGDVPGADPRSCGNYLDQNLPMAKYEANKFLKEVLNNIKDENLVYPE